MARVVTGLPSHVVARQAATGVTCCGPCATAAHLLAAGDKPRDLADYLAWPEQLIAARLRAHGHHQLAARVAPTPAPRAATPIQQTLDLGRTA